MQLENSFQVGAPPDRVFAYLLDVQNVAGCVPGAELSEVVDQSTFKGKVKIKVGPITVAYNGTARIVERDDADRSAKLSADGRETTGSGSARATATMRVEPSDGGSLVKITTEYHVAGRVAQFGRGVMEDVSRRMVNEMAACIKSNVETAEPPGASPAPASGGGSSETAPPPGPSGPPAPAPAQAAASTRPVNAFGLLWYLVALRVRRLFGGKPA